MEFKTKLTQSLFSTTTRLSLNNGGNHINTNNNCTQHK